MLDWFNQAIFTVILTDVLLRLAVAGLILYLVVRWILRLRRHYREQHARIEAQLKREQAFSRLGYQLNAATTPRAAADIIVNTAQELLHWHATALKLYDPETRKAESIINCDLMDGRIQEVSPPESLISPIMELVFKEGSQLILRNDDKQAVDKVIVFGDTNRRSASLMYVPIRNGTKPIGMLSIQSYDRNAYNKQDLEVLQNLADHCGGALERIRAESSSRAAYGEMEERVKQRTLDLLGANSRLHEEVEHHKRTELALAQEQHVLKALMDNIPDYIYFKDAQGHFTRVNTAFANQFGNCDPEEMIGKTDFDFLSPGAAQESFDDEQKIIETGKALVAKEEHEIWLNGHEWWVLTSKMPFRDENGRIVGTFGLTRDITQRKKAEEALHQAQYELEKRVQERTAALWQANEQLLAEISERKDAQTRSAAFSNLGYKLSQVRTREEAADMILDVAHELLGWHAAYLHLYTQDHQRIIPVVLYDEIEGKRVVSKSYLKDDLLSPRDRKIIEQGAELILREAPVISPELSQFGDTKRPSLSLMYVPIRNGTRVIGGLSIQSYSANAYTQEDLNMLQGLADFCSGTLERIEAEHALRESEARFFQAFVSSPVPMTLSTLREGRYFDVNDSMLRFMGWTRDEVIGKTSLELGLWPSPAARARMVDAVSKNRSVRDMECDFYTKSRELRKTLLSVELMDLKGEPTILVSVYDITDRLNLEEQLRHSQKMQAVGQLAAGVAHDFNNILTIIQGHTSLLLNTPGIGSAASESLSQMSMATDRAANLTRQLLTFSRKQVMEAKPIDLNELVGVTSKMLQRLLGENVSLHFNYSPHLPCIHADPGMMEQILLNLAVNSRDAMPHGGRLVITTETMRFDQHYAETHPPAREGQFVCLTVTDTGCGMDAATLTRVFEPFFTTKEIGKGTGLGLATVYGIVQQHDGWVNVTSEVDKGTTFKIYLPTTTKAAKAQETSSLVPPVDGGRETILVVEDEPALRELVKSILELYGYQVIEAVHGKEALVIWSRQKENIDLLLTDIVMPEGVSGLDLAEQLKKEDPALKVIYTSGYSMDLFTGKNRLVEGVNFLAKPYQPKALARTVRECLDA